MRRRGFTLLEVMVALAILASALVAASQIVSAALRNHVRAQHLEIATLLARGKMAALEERYEWKGFRAQDEQEEGTFEDDGHPEVKWRLEAKVPPIEAGPDQIFHILTGQDLKDILPTAEKAPQLAQQLGPLQAMLAPTLGQLGEKLKRGVRQVKLTVSWPEGAVEESFAVTTHMVVLVPGESLPR